MNILSKEYDGGGNWVVARETKPYFDGETLVIRQSNWRTNGGRAEITSYVIVDTESIVSILVGYRYSGKYFGGSQYWQHFKNGKRVSWKSFDDGERMLILDGYYSDTCPNWANVPGKLVRDYLKPNELRRLEIDEQGTIYGYKYLLVDSVGLIRSPQRLESVWENKELESDKEPTESNSSGIYAMKSRKSKVLYSYSGESRILVRLALSGTVIEANEGLRAQHAQIVEILS